ncbi:MAG: glutathione peroxidase [Micrococcaceae bacterium]
MTTIYDFTVTDQQGKDVSLGQYRGKVLLVVNTATQCGSTLQYDGLETLYKKYKDEGFEILDFPCNQFNEQAPEDIAEIDNFCRVNYGTEFPRFAKINVNGPNADPLYQWLRQEQPNDSGNASEVKTFVERITPMNPYVQEPGSIKWNFTKFLISSEGEVIDRFATIVQPEDLEEPIASELQQ